MSDTYLRAFTDARRVSAPFVVVRTPDQFSTRGVCLDAASGIKSSAIPTPFVTASWDAARGLAPIGTSPEAKDAFDKLLAKAGVRQPQTVDPVEAILASMAAPTGSILVLHNIHRHWDNAAVAQALANARDEFKRTFRMFLMTVPMGVKPPDEIKHDCIVLDVPLPNAETLRGIAQTTIQSAGVVVDDAHVTRAADGVRGLGAFVAETALAMALRKKGVDADALLEQRIAAIEQVKGVTVYRGKERFTDVIGLAGVKADLARLKTSKRPVRVVVVFDEFEKTMGGSQQDHGDNTGIKQGNAGHLLSWMQDKKVRGIISFGHPGTGKSYAAKALANELGCVCLMVDLNAALDSLVGASERNLRAITDLIDALAGEGGAFIVATCNSMSVLTTEMRRRFNRGLWFYDLSDGEAREAAWQYWCGRYKLDASQPKPHDDGWTPSEIAVCCEKADDYGISLVEAGQSVVPVATSQPEVIEERRRNAHRRLLDAATGRVYAMPGAVSTEPTTARAIAM